MNTQPLLRLAVRKIFHQAFEVKESMYTKSQYKRALIALGNRISEGQRLMLSTHAAAPAGLLDVHSLARSAGQDSEQYTYSQYGRLGHMLADVIEPNANHHIWTRVIGKDSRNPINDLVEWRIHPHLREAVEELGWISFPLNRTELDFFESLLNEGKTTRDALIEVRLKQALFRRKLLTYWGGCAVTGCKVFEALVAAHIKPWAKCTSRERVDQWNGLLLVGTLDRLFDAGLISFEDAGGMIISSFLKKRDLKALGITSGSQLERVDPRHKKYLSWHRKRVFVI